MILFEIQYKFQMNKKKTSEKWEHRKLVKKKNKNKNHMLHVNSIKNTLSTIKVLNE